MLRKFHKNIGDQCGGPSSHIAKSHCVFAHGHNQKTITGTLKDFPRNVAEFELGNERAAKYYLGLYRRIEA